MAGDLLRTRRYLDILAGAQRLRRRQGSGRTAAGAADLVITPPMPPGPRYRRILSLVTETDLAPKIDTLTIVDVVTP